MSSFTKASWTYWGCLHSFPALLFYLNKNATLTTVYTEAFPYADALLVQTTCIHLLSSKLLTFLPHIGHWSAFLQWRSSYKYRYQQLPQINWLSMFIDAHNPPNPTSVASLRRGHHPKELSSRTICNSLPRRIVILCNLSINIFVHSHSQYAASFAENPRPPGRVRVFMQKQWTESPLLWIFMSRITPSSRK